MVQGQQGEPSMLMPRFMEGSVSRSEPSTVKTDIVDGSILGSEPSMSEVDIVEGSGEAGRTIHVNALYHGWFGVRITLFMKTKAVQTAETIHPVWLLENIRSPRS